MHAIKMKLRRERAKRLRRIGRKDEARILEDENITTEDLKEMTKRTERKIEKLKEQSRKRARAVERERLEVESELDALRKRTRDV